MSAMYLRLKELGHCPVQGGDFKMSLRFYSDRMKAWMAFIVSLMIVLCTDFATPLCQTIASVVVFDEMLWVKTLVFLLLCCVLLVSFLWANQFNGLARTQIKKALKWQLALRTLRKSPLSLAPKIQKIHRLSKEMRLDFDLVAHYPETDFKKVRTQAEYELYLETLIRVVDVYCQTLSDAYYRYRYYPMNRGTMCLRKR